MRYELLDASPPTAEEALVARVMGALADSFADLTELVDEDIERLDEAVADARRPLPELRHEMLARRDRLIRPRRLVRRQRDSTRPSPTASTRSWSG